MQRSETSILIVEDEPVIAANIERMLDRMGYRVAGICRSSDEVMPLLISEHPAVVLMDICIDGPMDGIALAERIRDLAGIPVVYLSALMDDETIERAKITQPFGYVAKPFSQRELEITLEIAVYKAGMEERLARQEIHIQHLIDKIHQGFCLVDARGRVQYANLRFARMAGLDRDALPGREIRDLLAIPGSPDDPRHGAWENDEAFETLLTGPGTPGLKVIVTAQHLDARDAGGGVFLSVTDPASVVRLS